LRTPRGLLRPVAVAAVAVGVLTLAAPLGTTAAPIVIGRSEVADGSLRLTPAVQAVAGTEAVWVLANGGDRPMTFALTLHEVVVDDRGGAVPGAQASTRPPADEVTLAAGEEARIPVSLDALRAIALQATAPDAAPLHAFAVVAGDGPVSADIALDTARGRAVVSLSAETPTVARVTVAAESWPGRRLGSVTSDAVVVIPPGVTITSAIRGAVGPTTVEAAVTAVGGATTSARTSAFVVTRTGLASVAAGVLGLAVIIIVITLRRRGRSHHVIADPEEPT
jgi:hypothetical protein